MTQVYVACRMTGRDRLEMVKRAKYVSHVLAEYGLRAISPVIEESVPALPGALVNDSKERLKGFWDRDKYIIRHIAHVTLIDGAEAKSWGVEREYALSRFCLWKPTVLITPNRALSVADFEDDFITADIHEAAEVIRTRFGTRFKRIMWRLQMLRKTLPYWLYCQVLAFR